MYGDNKNVVLKFKFCSCCGYKLKKFNITDDWNSRKYLKKCWKKLDLSNPISYDNYTGKMIVNQKKLTALKNNSY